MPGQLKEVRNRIKSVQSIQQITKAMKMVSAAKLRRATDAIVQMRPYALKLQDMLQNIVANSDGGVEMSLAVQRPVENVLIVVITSDRGLCGAYNANLIKLAKQTIRERYPEQMAKGNVSVLPIGKKGYDHFIRHQFNVISGYRDLFQDLSFDDVQKASAYIMQAFSNKEFDVVEIIYSQFRNAVMQEFQVERFLPIPGASPKSREKDSRSPHAGKYRADFIFEPGQEELVRELMPKILNTQLFKAILDAHASEHGARMTSMDKATDNAEELLRNYRISYNRARQAAITTELTEIVSGAAALEG
jgi:F-type H+-transporting ATPase subunit gamma